MGARLAEPLSRNCAWAGACVCITVVSCNHIAHEYLVGLLLSSSILEHSCVGRGRGRRPLQRPREWQSRSHRGRQRRFANSPPRPCALNTTFSEQRDTPANSPLAPRGATSISRCLLLSPKSPWCSHSNEPDNEPSSTRRYCGTDKRPHVDQI
jgi:hypothetical protein